MEVNLKGTFIVTQVILPDMKAAVWGRIVNISSSSAQSGAARMAHYSASKGAIIALTKTLAVELGPLGITCNNIPPRFVMNTVMSEKFFADDHQSRDAWITPDQSGVRASPKILPAPARGWFPTRPAMSRVRPSASTVAATSDPVMDDFFLNTSEVQ